MSRRDGAAVGVPALLAAVLCAIELTTRSLGFDEAASVAISSQAHGTLGQAIAHDGGNMSGYYLFLHLWTDVFGTSTLALRLPSVFAIVAATALVGLLALRLFDRRVACAAGALTAVSMPLVFWGQDARGYAPMVMFVIGSFLAYMRIVQSPQPPTRGAWLGYVAWTSLALYCGFVAALVLPAQLLALVWRRRSVPAIGSAIAACLVVSVPLMVLAADRGSSQLFWVPHPSLTVEKQTLELLTSAGLQPSFHPQPTMWVLIAVTVLAVFAAAGTHVVRAWRPAVAAGDELWGQALVFLWVFVPIVLAFGESLVATPVFIPRNLLICLPGVALALALAITDARVPKLASCAALATLIALRMVSLVPTYGASPENWRTATRYVLARARPGDCVAFYPLDAHMPFAYYAGRAAAGDTAPRSVLPTVPWTPLTPYAEQYATLSPAAVRGVHRGCPRLWLVSAHEGQPHGPSAESRFNWAQFLALRGALERAYRDHVRTQFSYAATIHIDLLARH
ncbi:MAG TPA: glycosyltransferase family 39 protein [Solirubrobacteraceae bacterium]|nr:glycosyltransferase family 39 protein [Solirubrobacteraceae bacterium]